MVISEGCEIDKSPTVLIAPFRRNIDTESGLRANIAGGRVWRAFRLSELPLPGWADLRNTQPTDKGLLEARLDKRECSLTPEGQLALAGWFFAYLTHAQPPSSRYFRDSAGVVWDVVEVTVKDTRRTEDQVRDRVPLELVGGWLLFASPREIKRVAPPPEGWQYYADHQLEALIPRALAIVPNGHCAASEQAAKQRALAEQSH